MSVTKRPVLPTACVGLEDHSEELDELSERDRQIRFYDAMARIDPGSPALVGRLCEVISRAIFDLCAIHLRTHTRELRLICAHDVNPVLGTDIGGLIADDLEPYIPTEALLELDERGITELREMTLRNGEDPSIQLGVHSVLIVKLPSAHGPDLGTLMVARHATRRRFTPTDVALLRWIANSVAMMLETSRLHRDLRRKNAALANTAAQLRTKAEALADAVRARDDFIAAAAHELKTPLSTLELQTEIVRRTISESDIADESGVQTNLDAMQRQVRRLNRLVTRLLDTSQLKAGELALEYELVVLHELAAEVLDRFRRPATESGITLAFHSESICGYWDTDRLDQVISNLLSNALKYTKQGRIELTLKRRGGHAVIRVSDDGDGIPTEDLERIFDQFERGPNAARQSGLGLGLWITTHIVQRLGGSITVRSEPGTGSQFEVVLPIRPPIN